MPQLPHALIGALAGTELRKLVQAAAEQLEVRGARRGQAQAGMSVSLRLVGTPSKRLGVGRQALSNLVNERASVSIEIADRIRFS